MIAHRNIKFVYIELKFLDNISSHKQQTIHGPGIWPGYLQTILFIKG